jgi:membrane associated rhomboid family serine protease
MYDRGLRPRSFRLPGDCPVTWALIGANVLTFLTSFLGFGGVWNSLVFTSGGFPSAPWTALTYPLVAGGQILWLLLGGYIFWLFGGSLERAWGRRDYLVFLALVAAAPAVAVWLGSAVAGRVVVLDGLWLPLAAATVAWATINPAERMLLYFVIPIEARWLGVLVVVLVVFSYPFPLGLFALAGCAAAWWYVRQGRYGVFRGRSGPARAPSRGRGARRGMPWNPLAWIRRWRLRRQFRRVIDESDLRDLDHGKGPH